MYQFGKAKKFASKMLAICGSMTISHFSKRPVFVLQTLDQFYHFE